MFYLEGDYCLYKDT